jgi:glyoxylase-like metal-dependent hydrolase (beta-lactamase superfamily II)
MRSLQAAPHRHAAPPLHCNVKNAPAPPRVVIRAAAGREVRPPTREDTMRVVLGAAAIAAMAAATGAGATTIEDVAKAMGVDKAETIQYIGAGTFYAVGQSFRAGLPWPKFNMVRATRAFDYKKDVFHNEFVVTQGEHPPRGGGQQPILGEQRRASGIAGDKAWIAAGAFTMASPRFQPTLLHDYWTSPHAVVRAALADKAKLVPAEGGAAFEVGRPGQWKARVLVDRDNLVVRVESWVDNPVLGDMAVVTTYGDYRDVAGVKVPARIQQSAGGFPVLDFTAGDIKVNAGAVAVPAAIRAPAETVKVEKAAEGVWFLAGGSHHSVAVEMRDHVVLFECPLGDARTEAVIAAVKQAVPGKPIRYAVNTHHHFDHSGGLRACAAEGAAIVTHESNKAFFESAYAAPRTLGPDALARSGRKAELVTFAEKHVLSDGTRTLELHRVKDNSHNDGLVIGYLPKEKILMVADAFSPREPITAVPATLNPFTTNLWANLQQLELDVETVLPIHGRMVKVDELRLAAGAK